MPITYSNSLAAYAVGRRVNMEEWNSITRSLEGATALGFGQPAVAGTGKHTVVPLSATGQNILGITEADATLPRPGDAYAQYDNVPVCESGVIGALLGANVTKGAQARFDITNKVWTGAAASGTILTIPGAQFDEAGSSGAVGVVRYRRPVPSVSA